MKKNHYKMCPKCKKKTFIVSIFGSVCANEKCLYKPKMKETKTCAVCEKEYTLHATYTAEQRIKSKYCSNGYKNTSNRLNAFKTRFNGWKKK